MPIPYLITTLLYVLVALLAAADAALVSLGLASPFAALRWVRVHFITLGVISQLVFGLLPGLMASLANKPRPVMRWDIWLLLNAGLVALVAGFAGVNQPMILTGGTLIFTAATLLLIQLWQVRGGDAPQSLKFYITGLFYLLVGIIIGTGLWLNWSAALYIQVPLEAHIHANSWGFMSLVFAGLLVDFVPMITGRPLGTTREVSFIFWGMTLGAFGLVLGPWLGGSLPPTVGGLILHLSATIWLLVLMVRTLKQSGKLAGAGAWHLVSSYLWILAPVLVAPLIILGFVAGGPIEGDRTASLDLWLDVAIWHCSHPFHRPSFLSQGRESATRRQLGQPGGSHGGQHPGVGEYFCRFNQRYPVRDRFCTVRRCYGAPAQRTY